MITSIRLANFQSHKDTRLELHPGVNSIVGSSDSGKTAILRALYWAFNNRPVGTAFVSHWNRNKSGDPVNPTAVSVSSADGWTVTRSRTKSFNGYSIEDNNRPATELEAVGTDVPNEVAARFNLTEVNFQRQMDAHFLLSETSGEVARFFNRIIRLDLIDRTLTAAESLRRKLKSRGTALVGDIKKLDDQLVGMAWLETADKLLNKAVRVSDRLKDNRVGWGQLDGMIQQHNRYTTELGQLGWIDTAERTMTMITETRLRLKISGDSRDSLRQLYKSHQEQVGIIAETPDLSGAESLLAGIQKIQDRMKKDLERGTLIDIKIAEWKRVVKEIAFREAELSDTIKQLPAVCPLCGGPMNTEDLCKQ